MPSNESVHKRDDAREISTISSACQTSQMSAEDIVTKCICAFCGYAVRADISKGF